MRSSGSTPPRQRTIRDALTASPAFARFAAGLALYEAGTSVYRQTKEFVDGRWSYQVSIVEGDSVYDDVHVWMLQNVPESEHRNLVVTTRGHSRESSHSESPGEPRSRRELAPLTVMINDTSTHHITIDGYRVSIWVSKPERDIESKARFEPVTIRFKAHSQAGQRAVLNKIEEIRRTAVVRRPMLKMMTAWGSWSDRSEVPQRSLSSVILREGQIERIRDDLGQFLEDEEIYARLGMPYHRGYMFHGPAGTGKTSLAKGLANEFNLDVWYAPLSDLRDESSLMNLIADVRPRSMLLLEDIDTVSITHNREQSGGPGITMSSLLNALDGIATPHGLITCMTTNRFESLDPALTRAGRMDRVELIDLPTEREVRLMFRSFYEDEPASLVVPDGISQATVAEIFKRNMRDMDAAARALAAGTRARGTTADYE